MPIKYYTFKNILSGNFVQKSLNLDLDYTIASQGLFARTGLIILVILVCIIAGILAGFIGVLTSLEIRFGEVLFRLAYLSMILVVVIGIVTAIYKNFTQSLLTVILGLFLTALILYLLSNLTFLELSPLFFPVTVLTTAFGFSISIISFFITRFAIALTDVLFRHHRLIKSMGTIIIFLAVITGSILVSLIVIFTEQQNTESEFRDILLNSAQARIVLIFGSLVYTLGLAFSSWLANRIRGVPWNHPDWLRSLVLAAGCWGGTSFHNLDLSGVNLRGARLANSDLRARKLYRTCFQEVTGLERARVDSRYLDLENPQVQRLLTHCYSDNKDFRQLNLRGTYLRNADMRRFNLTDTDLTGADLQGADLRGAIMIHTQVIDVNFTHAKLTGICNKDWSVNSQTDFTEVECDYIYRELDEQGEPTDRFPANRNFEPREFESLYQEVGNVVELIFKEGENWQAALFSLKKLQLEDESLELELKGIERRGDLWIVKVTHNENYPKQEVEQRLYASYEEMKHQLATKEQQVNQLLGIVEDQAKALKGYSQQAFGNSFFILGSTITNLAGSGQIDYDEAADQVRSIVANGGDSAKAMTFTQTLLSQLQGKSVATTSEQQTELIEQVIIAEAQKDPFFKQFLLQQGQQITTTMPENVITSAIQNAIAQL